MTTLQPTGASGIANLPAASSVSSEELSNDGLAWGDNAAEVGDSSFNFDTYATSVAASMSAAGFSPSQVSAFINGMYAGYLLDGGEATSQATGGTGGTSSNAGALGNPGTWGSLNLPGQGGQGGLEVGNSTQVTLSPSTAYNLGMQFGSQSSNVTYQQYRDNLSADLQRAGYTQSQVNAFMTALDNGHAATAGSSSTGATSTNATSTGATSTGATGGASAITDPYGWVIAGSTPAASVSLYTSYLSSSNPALAGDANQLQNDLQKLSSAQDKLEYAESCYVLAQSSSSGLLPDSTGTLRNAAWWGSQIGTLKTQAQGAWQAVRKDESKFYGDLAATSSDPNASTAAVVYQSFINDPRYTLEGTMPSSYAGQTITNTQTSTGVSTPAPVSSAALDALLAVTSASILPATVSNELTAPFSSKNISQDDFTKIVQGFQKLFQSNPQAYWAALGNIKDPNLAGAINYAVQDMSVNHPQQMMANGASLNVEKTQIGTYWTSMNKDNSHFKSWAPHQGDSQYNGSVQDLVNATKWNDGSDIVSLFGDANATSDNKHNEHNFSDACQFMAHLWYTNRPQYYAMLGKIADPKLRDMVNRDVNLLFVQHNKDGGYDPSQNTKGTGLEDTTFKNEWTSTLGQAGASAGSSNAKNSGQSFSGEL